MFNPSKMGHMAEFEKIPFFEWITSLSLTRGKETSGRMGWLLRNQSLSRKVVSFQSDQP